jgi:hypothetical protein
MLNSYIFNVGRKDEEHVGENKGKYEEHEEHDEVKAMNDMGTNRQHDTKPTTLVGGHQSSRILHKDVEKLEKQPLLNKKGIPNVKINLFFNAVLTISI